MRKTYTDFSQLSKGMFKKSAQMEEIKPLPKTNAVGGDDVLSFFGLNAPETPTGASGDAGDDGARPCHYEWAKGLSDQCRRHDVTFDFIETGMVFVKDGKEYRIPDKRVQSRQAYLSGLSFKGRKPQYRLRHPEGSLFD